MGFSYAVDMVNRMKQNRSRNRRNRERINGITDTIKLHNTYPKKIGYKRVSEKELHKIKLRIRERAKQEEQKNRIYTIVSIAILFVLICYFSRNLF